MESAVLSDAKSTNQHFGKLVLGIFLQDNCKLVILKINDQWHLDLRHVE